MLTVASAGSTLIRLGSMVVTEAGMRVKPAKKSSVSSTSVSSMIVTLKHRLGWSMVNVARVVVTLM